jgi:hypothetical protein
MPHLRVSPSFSGLCADLQEMILHALYENGGLAPSDIESHIKDDIEKEGIKLVDMDKKMGQAYKDVVSRPLFCFLPSMLRLHLPYSIASRTELTSRQLHR